MVTLANYPNKSQLLAKHNGPFDCVPASLADALEYLTHYPYTVDEVFLSAYPPDHVGGTAASAYIPYCEQQGVHLYALEGDGPTLVRATHQLIAQGRPVLITEPDVYAPSHPDWSHVLSMYREDAGSLTARDPYSTRDVTHTDAQWAALFEFHEIWTLEVINDMAISIQSPGVADHFIEMTPDRWHCKQKDVDIAYAFLSHYKATNGLQTMRLPISGEIPLELVADGRFKQYAGHGIVVMYFEVGPYVYDPGHLIDNPPGAGDVYPLKVYESGPGTDPRLWKLLQSAKSV